MRYNTTRAFSETMMFLEMLGLDPDLVESVHIDRDAVTVISFKADSDGQRILSTDGAERKVTKLDMENS